MGTLRGLMVELLVIVVVILLVLWLPGKLRQRRR
jgi:Sec-independent protein translocase protein TatA